MFLPVGFSLLHHSCLEVHICPALRIVCLLATRQQPLGGKAPPASSFALSSRECCCSRVRTVVQTEVINPAQLTLKLKM